MVLCIFGVVRSWIGNNAFNSIQYTPKYAKSHTQKAKPKLDRLFSILLAKRRVSSSPTPSLPLRRLFFSQRPSAMVLFHVKRGDKNEFLYETTAAASNDELIRALCRINNARLRLAALADALPGLGQFGAAKPPSEQGLDKYQDAPEKPRGEFYEPDPLGLRTGEGVSPQLREVLARVSEDAWQAVNSKQMFSLNQRSDEETLKEKLMNVRGAVMMAFPMGLPAHDPVQRLLNEEDPEAALGDGSSVLEVASENTAELWWAGKQFFRDQHVRDLVGTNEKTKVIVKLQRKGGGAPGREPAVSEAERQAMMAFYFKKQEELKQAAEDDAEDYMSSTWADPRALKNSLRGTQRIRPF